VAAANGLNNALKIIQGLNKEFKDYVCVEVMACPGGCIGGGGQPMPSDQQIREQRAQALYGIDNKAKIRMAHENPYLQKVYKKFLNNEEIRKKICRTYYSDKST
jgi:iron only hydrogenase large subunit-like protein